MYEKKTRNQVDNGLLMFDIAVFQMLSYFQLLLHRNCSFQYVTKIADMLSLDKSAIYMRTIAY